VTAGLLAGAAAVAAIGVASAQDDGADAEAPPLTAEGADAELLDRLLDIEADRPPFAPDAVLVDPEVADATLDGAFGEARIALDALEGELQTLFVDADDAGTPTGAAIALVTNGLLLEREAVTVLEEADDLDVARPVDSSDATDANGLAIDADDPTGTTLVGVDLLLDARLRQLSGYLLLADLDDLLADRYDTLEDYALEVDPLLREAVGLPADQLVVTVDRFDAPVGQARAAAASFVCVNRTVYLAAISNGSTTQEATALAATEPDDGCLGTVTEAP
jgi:hypothetical protein